MTLISERTLGARLKAARALSGLEQQDIADALGCARSSVSVWENDRADMGANYFIRYAQLTGVALDWLAWGVGPMQSTVVRPEGFEPPTFWLGVDDPRCFVCGGPHDLDDCPQADDLDDLIDTEFQLLAGAL